IIPSGKKIITRRNHKLIEFITDAQRYSNELKSGGFKTVAEIAVKSKIDKSTFARTVRFAYLAPDIKEAIIEGKQPPALTVTTLRKLKELPVEWESQRELLNF
ncbi:MAG: hypothetical protein P8I94_10450, partial [Emcibacteraceae bacterium]|nr:hypothetical protein [Emcibacteraceae bacterium]